MSAQSIALDILRDLEAEKQAKAAEAVVGADIDWSGLIKTAGAAAGELGGSIYKSKQEEAARKAQATALDAKTAQVVAIDAVARKAEADALYRQYVAGEAQKLLDKAQASAAANSKNVALQARAQEAEKKAVAERAAAEMMRKAAESTRRRSDAAGMGLSDEVVQRRIAAANDAAQKAEEAASAAMSAAADAPTSAQKQVAAKLAEFMMQAASETAQRVAGSPGVPATLPDGSLSTSYAPASASGGGSSLDFLTRKYGPLPGWGWGALVAAVLAGGFLAWRKFRKPTVVAA